MIEKKSFVANTYEEAIEIFAEAFRNWDPEISTIEFIVSKHLYDRMSRLASEMRVCGQPVTADASLNFNEIKIIYRPVTPITPIKKQEKEEKETILYLVNIKPEHKDKFKDTLIHSKFCGELVNQTNDMFYFELYKGRAIVIIPHNWIEFMAPIKEEN